MGRVIDWLVENSPEFRKRRLPSLYSDFRPAKNGNPDGYGANIAAWYDGLARSASWGLLPGTNGEKNLLVLTVDERLRQILGSNEFGQPQALGCAITEAISRRELILLPNYLSKETNVYQKPWAETPWNVMEWALQQMGLSSRLLVVDTMPIGQYVITRNVERAGAELMRRTADLESKYERILTKAELQAKLEWKMTELDWKVLLKYLEIDVRKIARDSDRVTIRIQAPGDEDKLGPLDHCVVSLRILKAQSETQIESCTEREKELDADIKEALRLNKRTRALHLLRLKKILEASLARKYATVTQLEEIEAKLQQAEAQVEFFAVMADSTGVLSSINAQMGDFEQIIKVKERLEEGMATTDEIAAALTEVSGGVDEAGLDEELEAMENEQREAKEALELARVERQLDELSVVPENMPEGRQTLEGRQTSEGRHTSEGRQNKPEQEKEAKMVTE